MPNLHRDKNVKREPGRDGKIVSVHRQDGNVEAHRLQVRWKKKKEKKGVNFFPLGACAQYIKVSPDNYIYSLK